jgi:hypothetical protein
MFKCFFDEFKNEVFLLSQLNNSTIRIWLLKLIDLLRFKILEVIRFQFILINLSVISQAHIQVHPWIIRPHLKFILDAFILTF